MKVGDKHYRSIWLDKSDNRKVNIIDQRKLPFSLEILSLASVDDIYNAISGMALRGAPLIGAAGAFGMYLATLEITSKTRIREHLNNAARYLISARPTAVNLEWAVTRQLDELPLTGKKEDLVKKSRETATGIADMEVNNCEAIGKEGLPLIEKISRAKKGSAVNILTHCNAGWLACVDYGTATAPIYLAHDRGIKVHVWVDETRPRNQGARLTAYELGSHGVDHTLITDNAAGQLMQKGLIDMVIVGSDRTTARGDVANKTGTYLKALAAKDNNIPFYVALPTSSFDVSVSDGLKEVIIEERSEREVSHVEGLYGNEIVEVQICKPGTKVSNLGFDITPARLVSGLITEKGVIRAEYNEINKLFTDNK